MARTTRKMVDSAFARFVAQIGGAIAKSYNDVGGYTLDYNGVYGGYQVVQILSETGAQTCPFGYMRRKAAEMADTLNFACDALRVAKENGAK
jgi:hypothetical protein